MFRRKREVSGPPSIPWWPAGSDPAGAAPPLATDDPFGGWPAFAEDTAAPDHLVGRASDWAAAEQFLAEQHAAEQHAADHRGRAKPIPAEEHGSAPRCPVGGRPVAPPATPDPSTVGSRSAVPAAATGEEPATTEWLPLLTHPVGGQRFLPDVEDPAAARPTPGPPPPARNRPEPAINRARDGRRKPARRRPEPTSPTRTDPDHAPGVCSTPEAATTSPGDAAVPPDTEGPAGPAPDAPTLGVAAPDAAEASALAGAFAADYLSWDQDNPERRGQVLEQYLRAATAASASALGWSGRGRQRAELVLPGAVRPDGAGRVLVDVRVRVTPYLQVGEGSEPPPGSDLEVSGTPAAAPAPTARGWKSLDSCWVRMSVPVTRDGDRLIVDRWDAGTDPR